MKTLRQCATGGISPFFSLLFFFVLFFNHANAQLALINEFTPPSAQASQFTKYGKYNPQLYTGTLSLSIPIYTYKDKDFEIPVSLDYSYNGLIANKQASEVGLGWSLGCGGYITREVRGIPDEEMGTIVWTESRIEETLYGFDFVPFANADSLGTLNVTPFSKLISPVDVIKTFYTYNRTNYESSADLYHFSFLGKMGSFIRNTDGSFTVFHSSSYNGEFKVFKENSDDYQSKGVASQFIITTGDGYKYYFGDINSNDAVYTERAGSSGKDGKDHMTILAWKLMKIVAPSGRTVNYVYEDHPFEIQNYTSPSWYNLQSTAALLSTSLSTVTCSCLTEINIDGGGSLRFMYSFKPLGKTGKYISGRGLLDITGTSPLLTNIICSNTEAELGYTYNLTGSPNPFLKNVSIKGIGNYSMDYYGLEDGYFPPSGTVATDHWGYANESNEYLCNQNSVDMSSISTVNSSTYVETLTGTRKEPNYYISLLGIMNRISYPTQGYSSFTYEPNIYYRRVSRESVDNFFPSPHVISGEGPGARIRRIANYNSDGTLSNSTSYRYIKSDGTSSGTLLKYPRYIVLYGATVNGVPYLTANVSLATMGGLMSYDAVPIEYSRVEEILPDSSKTVYHFSSIDETDDIPCNEYHQIGHLFEYSGQYYIAFASVPNVDRINHILAPESSMQSQRGKLIGMEVFRKDGTTPLQKTVSNYDTQAEMSHITEHYGVGEYAGDVPLYTGDYPLTSTESTSYTTSDSVKQTVSYSYNSLGQKTIEAKTQSNGDILYTYYTYITDMDSTQRSVVEKAMYKANVISYPVNILVKIKRSGETGETVISRDKYVFSEYSNSQGGKFYRPTKWEKLNVSTGALYTQADFLYDNDGDMIEKKDANGLYTSYIWGQGGLGVVILIENASNAEIREVPNCSGIFNSRVAEGHVQSIADSVRTWLPRAQVSSYEYFRYGLPSKITDPSGKSTTYTYDDSERLTGIKDGKNDNIEQYNYNSITK